LAQAQQSQKVFRVGYLSALSAAAEANRFDIIRSALREHGYIENRNIVFENRYSEGKSERAAELAADLVRLNVDLIIVAGGDVWIRAARTATKKIPLVMTGGGLDPIAAGHVESLNRPGANVTGLTILNTELTGKRLELLKEAVPKLNRVAVLHDPAIPSNVQELKDLQAAARPLKLILEPWEVRDASGLAKVFALLGKERPDALYICQGGILNNCRNSIADFALKIRLPSVHSAREFTDAGGMMTYGADRAASYRRIAYYVDRILKGAKPGDLPVEQPTKFELIINLKVAKEIGVNISPNVLARADRVIR